MGGVIFSGFTRIANIVKIRIYLNILYVLG